MGVETGPTKEFMSKFKKMDSRGKKSDKKEKEPKSKLGKFFKKH